MFQGILEGFDQSANLVLSNCEEKVYTSPTELQSIPLGAYLIRGDSM